MHNTNRHFIIMGMLLALAALASLYFPLTDRQQSTLVSIQHFPRTIGQWVSQDLPISAQDLVILKTDNVFLRRYQNPRGQKVYLYIVYSQTSRSAAHPPEICYTGDGVSILEKDHDAIAVHDPHLTINAARLLLKANHMYQVSYYWFKVGNKFTSNYLKEQLLVAYDTLLGKRKGSALIRISADLDHDNEKSASQMIKDFADQMTPQLLQYLP